MANPQQTNYMTEQEYLQQEQQSDLKHEYIDGQVYAMAGAKASHNRIVGNFYRKVGNYLENKPCQPYMSDMQVKIASKYFYPDVLVDCSNLSDDSTFTETPILIVEVLSKSTRRADETTKRMAYMQIPTLLEYVLIEQDFVQIEVMSKNHHWQSFKYYLGDDIHFESIGLCLKVEDIYERVQNSDMLEWLKNKTSQ
ncbi:MAG TPA: Uma2 family endonuclease [Agitococcus sp.]|uniref:Uma2 family endonuclease n=1 Tax=uncultured Agitococcus sp. TaxID=1506599 RepID=UPI0026027D8A|nr:Uma2 family endonuclease [uncultured Agitococcus sp.]HMV61552.1 Uma2 family endonuclease [Agitococcus sp.]HMY27952.1 Uma2 family endonuclease [Agitococcus sp.]HNA21910.1 Uma2 family endonuclease [Agitococcus sp.]HNG46549.1 Uma2 family endonuclease [Agitococcus sp.]HNI62396.1 Uma2 family endonuclease [Agitococcus sp.]